MTDLSTLPVLSATQIKMFMTCRRLYYHAYKERLPHSEHIAGLLGGALHEALEQWAIDNKNPRVVFMNAFNESLEKATAAGTLKFSEKEHELKILGLEILGKVDWGKVVARNQADIERRFLLPFPNKRKPIAMINGVIDLILPTGDIVDHKSTSRLPTKADMANDPQFILYRWAVHQMEGKYPAMVLWHHLRTGAWVDTKVEVDFTKKLAAVVATVKTMIAETVYDKKPKADFFCYKICDHYNRCWNPK